MQGSVRMTLLLFWLEYYPTFGIVKTDYLEGNFVPNKKAGPQFADANEEPAYRSAVQNSPAICVFLADAIQ